MTRRRRSPAIPVWTLALVAAAAVAGAADPAPPFSWPAPDGWRTETIPFPLEFAPGLEYEGLEELRFAPGMFTVDSPDYWTYAFVWWVPEDTPVSAGRLGADLSDYFAGLTTAVAASRGFDPGEVVHRATVEEVGGADHDGPVFEGAVATFDAFTARAPLALNLRAEAIPCHQVGRTAVFVALSPQPRDHPVWRTLGHLRASFGCVG